MGDEIAHQGQGALWRIGQHAVAGVGKLFKAQQVRGQQRGNLALVFDGQHGVQSAAHQQGGAAHAGQVGAQVKGAAFAVCAAEPAGGLGVSHLPLQGLGVGWCLGVQRQGQAQPVVQHLWAGVALDQSAPSQVADLGTAQGLKQRHAALGEGTAARGSADQDQLARVLGVPGGISLDHDAAKTGTQDDGTDDAQGVAEDAHVVGPLRQRPQRLRSMFTAAVASVVQVDELSHIA